MNREEAKHLLNNLRSVAEGKEDEAIDMAIEALHREEAEEKGYCHRIRPSNVDELSATNTEKSSNCGDLISRADAMGTVQDHFNADGFKGYDDGQKMMDRIKALPSADRPAGEWEEMEILCNPYPPLFCVECSECGYRVGRETYLDLENTFNFCPNCGAYMRNQNNE